MECLSEGRAPSPKNIGAVVGGYWAENPRLVSKWKYQQSQEFRLWLDEQLDASAKATVGAIAARLAGIAVTKGSVPHAELAARLAGKLLDGRQQGSGAITVNVAVATAPSAPAAWPLLGEEIAKIGTKVGGESVVVVEAVRNR